MKEIIIKKPLFGNYCNIREKYLREAIRRREPLKITIPQGSAMINPAEWIRTGKATEQVFLIPDRPMKMWGNYVKIDSRTDEEKSDEWVKKGWV